MKFSKFFINHLSFCIFIVLSIVSITSLAEGQTDPSIIGFGFQSSPAYIGSNSNKINVVPILSISNNDRFIQTTEGILETGFKHDFFDNYSMGVQLAYEEGRFKKDATFLKKNHLKDIFSSASYGVFLQYENEIARIPIDVLLRYRKDIDTHRGSQFDIRGTVGIYGGESKRLNAELFAQTTYANQNSSQYYYGISQEQSSISTLNVYDNKAGFLSSQIGLWASYDITPKWLLVGDIEIEKLLGGARNSPLTKNISNTSMSIGLAFKY